MDAYWKHCLADFLRSLHSTATRTSYATVLIRFCSEHEPEQVTRRDIEEFMRMPYPDPHRKEQKELAASTQNLRVAAIASFYNYASSWIPEHAAEPLWDKANPTTGIVRGKAEHSPKGLTLEQLERLFSIIPMTTEIGIRDKALLLFYLYSARRRSELASIRYGDIQSATFHDEHGAVREGYIYYFRGKGHKETLDSQELPQPVKDAIDWMLISSGRWETIKPEDPLFVTTGNKAKGITASTIAKRMAFYARKAGLHASLHTLRHSAAKIRHESGEDILSIMRLLRHQDLRTTWLYLQGLTGTEDKGAKLLESRFGRFS